VKLKESCAEYLRHEKQNWRPFARNAFERLRSTIRTIDEFKGYVGGNRRGVPNFARARAAGQPLYYG
jgi:hypothetical protein